MNGQRDVGRTNGYTLSQAEAVALQAIRAALGKRQMSEAVRLLLKAVVDGALPQDERLGSLIVAAQGKRFMLALLEACAHQACFYCSKGRTKCGNCEGEGHFGGVEPCRFCLGMAIVRCEFCDGSAWATINTFPPGLRPLIVRRRLQIASLRMGKMMKATAPIASREKKLAAKAIYLHIIGLDRQLGIVENAMITLHGSARMSALLQAPLTEALALAARTRERVARLFGLLSESQRRSSGGQGGTLVERQRSIRRGELVASMIENGNGLNDTTFAHPFLERAFTRASARRSKKRKRPVG